jgi:A/G-specific adenine glycosylase
MLQQTRVETVVGFFERWMKRFPTTASLAAASEQEVLSQWEGLGYYSRARNLHRAAKIIISNHDGVVPKDIGELQRLPGIGRYTAGAIASIAYGMDAAALDGNIRRVLARLFDVETPADSVAGLKQLWKLAEENLPPGKAGDYNQAMMDLGASLCLPRNPQCQICPLRTNCKARKVGTQQVRPVLKQKPAIPHFVVTAAVIIRRGKVLLAQRPADKLLGGMWEFPGGKVEKGETLEACLRREILEELGTTIRVGKSLGVYKHAYTHFRITVHAFCCELAGTEPRPLEVASIAWVHLNKLVNYPMGKVDRLIARRIGEDGDTIPL